jgi:integrase
MDRLFRRRLERETLGMEDSRQPAQDVCKRKAGSGHSPAGGNPGYVSKFHRQPAIGCDVSHGRGPGLDIDKLVLRDVRPVAKSLDIDWYGLHGFRRGIASNLYELGADEKIVQRVLRHAKSHVTKDRYIKTFDPALVAAMKKLEATVDLVNQSAPRVHQIN